MYDLRTQGLSLEDIGKEYGCARERVRQIVTRYEQQHELPSSLEKKQQLLGAGRKEKEQQGRAQRAEERRQKNMQSRHFVNEVQLDAHLVGSFIQALGTNTLYYRYYGKNKTRKSDGKPFPCNTKPTCVEFADYGKWKLHTWVMAQYGLSTKRGESVHHIDGDITNNMRENLVILTNQEHGRITYAESADITRFHVGGVSTRRKFTMDVVRKIRAEYAAGRSIVHSSLLEFHC